MAATATATALPTIFLILIVAFTVTTTAVALRLPPSDPTLLLKKCTEVLSPNDTNLVQFCARDLLSHRAAFLATCDRRKTVAVVLKEAHNKVKAFEALEKKINSDKSLSAKEVQDLKRCWGFINKVVCSTKNMFSNALVKEASTDSLVELKGIEGVDGRAAMKEQCHFPAVESNVWLELKVKAVESLRADMVAMAFVDHLYSITH